MGNVKQSFLASLFSIITIGILTGLTYKTELGIFLLASFGSSMVLLYGYPESPFAQPKNVFFWTRHDYFGRIIFFISNRASNIFDNPFSCRFGSWLNDIV